MGPQQGSWNRWPVAAGTKSPCRGGCIRPNRSSATGPSNLQRLHFMPSSIVTTSCAPVRSTCGRRCRPSTRRSPARGSTVVDRPTPVALELVTVSLRSYGWHGTAVGAESGELCGEASLRFAVDACGSGCHDLPSGCRRRCRKWNLLALARYVWSIDRCTILRLEGSLGGAGSGAVHHSAGRHVTAHA